MSEEEYKFIILPKKDEEVSFRRSMQFRGPSEKAVDEFLLARKKHGINRAKVRVPPPHDKHGFLRGVAKILKRKAPQFTARLSSDGEVWIIEK